MLEKLKRRFGFDEPVVPKTAPMLLLSPLSGRAVPLEEVADEVFSKSILGQGVAIIPSEGRLVSPIDGKVVQIFDTLHAITIISPEGLEVLLHVGLETVTLGGRHYQGFVKKGDAVQAGQLLIRFDLAAIQREGFDPITPVLLTNRASQALKLGDVIAGEPLLKALEQQGDQQ